MKFPFIISLLLFLFTTNSFCQNGQPHFEQFLTEHGLPSREVYVSYQDKEGMMWFGTDNGVTKYDGYEFINYSTTSIYEDNVINTIFEDCNGVLWLGSMFGEIFYLKENKLHPYKYNSIIRKYRGKFVTSTFEYIDKQGTFYLGLFDLGILEIDKYGKEKLITSNENTLYVIKQIENRIIGTRSILPINKFNYFNKSHGIKFIKNEVEKIIHHKGLIPTGYERFYNSEIDKDSNIYFYIDRLCYIKGGKIYTTSIKDRINNVKVKNDFVYLCFGNNNGMAITTHDEISKGNIQNKYLNNQTVSGIFLDKQKGLWVSTINNGVYYARRPDIKVWQPESSNNGEFVTSIAPINESNCYFGAGVSKIHLLQNEKIKSLPLFPISIGFCDDMEYINNKLYVYGGFFENGKWKFLFQKNHANKKLFSFKELSTQPDYDEIWFTNFRSFGAVHKAKNRAHHQSTISHEKFTRIYDILFSKKGEVWIGTQEGLYKFENNKVKSYTSINRYLNLRITTLEEDNENNLIIGSKDFGLFAYNLRSNIVQVIDQSISKNYIRNSYFDKNNSLWISTNKGLYKYKKEQNTYTSRRFTKAHGLPTEEIFQCKIHGNTIWLATSNGLVKFFENNIVNNSPKPQITKVENKNGVHDYNKSLKFKHNENNIIVTYRTTNYRLLNNIQYRIKSNIDSTWRHTTSTQLELTGLQPGYYNYEIQSANEDIIWSKSTALNFEISTPWWKTYSFIFLLASFIITFFLFGHRYRTKRIRQESELKAKVNKLEKMALQSQMNPHFISNVFSSLQYMINTNKLVLAEEYLTDLSALIRRILENSRMPEVNLKQELELLKLYINLELVRYENKFEVLFIIDDNINIESIFIPPMMLQPIVENAITHGLHNLIDRKGSLKISAKKINNKLIFIIEDNGVGRIKGLELASRKPHKSYALDILKERVANINNVEKNKVSFEIKDKNQKDEFGTIVVFEFTI